MRRTATVNRTIHLLFTEYHKNRSNGDVIAAYASLQALNVIPDDIPDDIDNELSKYRVLENTRMYKARAKQRIVAVCPACEKLSLIHISEPTRPY